jgi:glyoxylase-like metal-dependent hydrolase (beta-lactamase superfamily II)
VAELALAVISHLHLDHSGGVRSLAAAGVPIAIHERELEFAFSNEATLKTGYYKPDWDGVDVDWRPLDGERQIADGLWIMFTPGHTPGHLSYRVELPKSGTWILAVDAGDLGQNFTEGIPPGHCSAGRPEDTHDAHASLSRLIDETRRRDARLVPGHDQLIWNAVKHPDGGHR